MRQMCEVKREKNRETDGLKHWKPEFGFEYCVHGSQGLALGGVFSA